MKAFAGSPQKIDIYYWLSHRLYSLSDPLNIGWDGLKEQFGEGYDRDRDFKAKFNKALDHIKEVFPKLPVKLHDQGMTLSPADSTVLAVPAKRSTKFIVKP